MKITKKDKFIWKIIPYEQALLIFENISLFVLHKDESESLIETKKELNDAIKLNEVIGIEVGFIPKKEVNLEIESSKKFLSDNGYHTDNLWNIIDVQSKFKCSEDEAYAILDKSLTNDTTMEQIWSSIDMYGDLENLTPIDN